MTFLKSTYKSLVDWSKENEVVSTTEAETKMSESVKVKETETNQTESVPSTEEFLEKGFIRRKSQAGRLPCLFYIFHIILIALVSSSRIILSIN